MGKSLTIKSRGQLSDAMQGRRPVAKTHLEKICRLFRLNGEEAYCFKLLVQLQNARDAEKKALYTRALSSVRATMAACHSIEKGHPNLLLCFEVFAAIATFSSPPDVEQLSKKLCIDQAQLLNALEHLESEGLVVEGQDGIKVKETLVIFNGSKNGFSHLDFLISTLKDAQARVPTLFERKDIAHFESMIFSVCQDKFRNLLPQIKRSLKLLQADLNSDKGNMLIHFNAQIYPTEHSQKPPFVRDLWQI